jgi:hypothetical protein
MKPLLLPFLLCFSLSCVAQNILKETFIYYDESGNIVKQKKAVLMRQTIQINDSIWETNIYRINKPRMVSFQSTTEDGRLFNGRYIHYDIYGNADTVGFYVMGKREGIWRISDDLMRGGRMIAEQLYEHGSLIWQKDTVQLNHERDSLHGHSPWESIKTKVEIESEFPGGPRAWLGFMNHNLRYPDEAVDKKLMGQTVTGFVVETDGTVPPASIWVDRSVAYPIDRECLRVIALSGRWAPAVEAGRQVRSYKKQPIVFKIEVFGR